MRKAELAAWPCSPVASREQEARKKCKVQTATTQRQQGNSRAAQEHLPGGSAKGTATISSWHLQLMPGPGPNGSVKTFLLVYSASVPPVNAEIIWFSHSEMLHFILLGKTAVLHSLLLCPWMSQRTRLPPEWFGFFLRRKNLHKLTIKYPQQNETKG